MRLADFLILILETHAQTLQRLAALVGEERLLEMLEAQDDTPDSPRDRPPGAAPLDVIDWMDDSTPSHSTRSDGAQAYAEIEGSVRDLALPEVLEFHLWAYPHYRTFIESAHDLNTRIRGAGSDAGIRLVEQAMEEAKLWVRRLPIPPAIGLQAERAAEIPWLRFRTLALKRIGKRPLGPVY